MTPSIIRNAQKVTIEFMAACPNWFDLLLNGSTVGPTPFYTLTFKDDDYEKRRLTLFSSSIAERKVYITAQRRQLEIAILSFIKLNPWLILDESGTIGYGFGDFENDRQTAEIGVRFHDLMSTSYVDSVNAFIQNIQTNNQ